MRIHFKEERTRTAADQKRTGDRPGKKKERNADIVVKDGKLKKYMQKEHYLQRQKQLPIRCLMQKVLW